MKRFYSLLLCLGAQAACQRQADAPMAPPPPAVHVATAVVDARPMPRRLPLTGSLVANQQADIAANASGRVVKTIVERGDFVRENAVLVQLDTSGLTLSQDEARANLDTAEAQQQLAAIQCQRNEELLRKGAISKDEWDRVNSQCRTSMGSAQAAKARAAIANKSFNDSTVRAPFSGMIGERYVSVGEYVQPPTRIASIVELTPLRLQLTIAEVDLSFVKQGQSVTFDVQAFPSESFTGTVQYIGPAVRSSTRDLVIEAVVPNSDHRLKPGMFATARLVLPDEKVPVVPLSALRRDEATTHLYVVTQGHIEERIVQIGLEREGYVAVLDGLRLGDTIVTQLTADVKDGVPVI